MRAASSAKARPRRWWPTPTSSEPTLALELDIRGVDAGYGSVRALQGVSMGIREGETVALLGTNGNGKSTLMKCVMGNVRPTRGEIILTLDGTAHDLTKLSTEEIVGLGVALVPEGRRLFPKLTVEENLLLGAFRREARPHIAKNLQLAYETFAVLKERRRQLAGSMSGGQQQMLAIARALMSSPKLLLVDEPSVGLSPLLVSNTVTMIKQLKEKHGLTVLMAEQNFHQAIRIADRGYLIVHGEIVFEGKTVEELEHNDMVKNYYLGTA
ncbi:MAG: ABC transporter ATP-binding protein [Betaproteobacteria bacterium]|nr:ABC transporter ATP-binding protein [Betaproteobacteria bacterium]